MSNENLLEKINAILDGSNLSEEDKDFWRDRLEQSSAFQKVFIQLFEDDSNLDQATKLLKDKINAGDDPEKIQKVVSEEIEMLKSAL